MADGVDRLKELLFDAEARRIAEVQRRLERLAELETQRHDEVTRRQGEISGRVDQVFDRAGTEERLLKSVASVLDGALREAEVTRHDQLSKAVAPILISTIKTELRNSRDEMVDALYPITGQMVSRYVKAELDALAERINAQFGGAKASDLERRAKEAGVSVGALALAETQALKVDELFLIRRGSGELVAHWERPQPGVAAAGANGNNRDALIASYLSGITSFAEDAFQTRSDALRSLTLSGERIFVRASPAYLLAARCSGRAPVAVEKVVDETFLETFGEHRDALAQPTGGAAVIPTLLPRLAERCESRFAAARKELEQSAISAAKRPSPWRRVALVAAVPLLAVLGWFGWFTWQSWQTQRVEAMAMDLIHSNEALRGFPIRADVAWGGAALALRGLTPDETARTTLVDRLRGALPDTHIGDELGVLPARPAPAPVAVPPDLTGDVSALREALAAARRDLTDVQRQAARLTPLESDIDARTRRLDTSIAELTRRIDAIRIPAPTGPTARQQLEAFIAANAVFFANGTDLLDDARALATLDALVPLARAADVTLRVVGYTDERGTSPANAALARARAERVADLLGARGVPRDKLIVLGRTSGPDIARTTGIGSANRRVAFELAFTGEPMASP
jgi:outer membrane protein OmpA-like peptidoglycan-associated protein